jgi:hypothetical protein
MGWITVGLYLLTALGAYRLSRGGRSNMTGRELRTWTVLSFLFLGLSLNKQFDLMSAITEGGRVMAKAQGWYGERRPLQREFVFGVLALGGLGACGLLALIARRMLLAVQLALLGAVYLIAFIAIRSTSLHRVDALLGYRWHDVKLNWVFEMGGILFVLGAVVGRFVTLRPRQTL